MDPTAVVEYLKEHPHFFEDYADVVAEIFVPHPHGGHAIPIAERQMLALRDRMREQERRLAEMVQNAAENDTITERLHRITLALIAAPDLETTIAVVAHGLKEDFAVPRVALRLWRDEFGAPREAATAAAADGALRPEFAATTPAVRAFAEGLQVPLCTPTAQDGTREWFDDGDPLASYAYLPLRTEVTFGLLALASPDAQRFHPAMGTVHLLRLGELASVGIVRHLAPL